MILTLYPLSEPRKANAIPELPDVASIIVSPFLINPFFSASFKIYVAILSLIDPLGFCPSNFAHILFDICNKGVCPTLSDNLSIKLILLLIYISI